MRLEMQYGLLSPGSVVAGVDSIDKLPELVSAFKAARVVLITDRGVWKAGLGEKPVRLLESAGIQVDVYYEVPPEPEMGQVEEVYREIAALKADLLIGLGGGSAMDVTKLVSVLMTNSCKLEEMVGTDRIQNSGVPVIMIPTTAGTGSEATPNAIVTIPEHELKVGIVSSKLIPDCVILDPAMTVKLPPAITASTGMDAFTHALECFISKKANPLSDTFALRAMKLIWNSIRTACRDGSNLQARHDMLLGSFFGGVCIASSGTAAVHALAYPLGGKYRIAHGVSNAMLLPFVTRFNMDAIPERLAEAAKAAGLAVEGLSVLEAAELLVKEIQALVRDLGIPSRLQGFGVEPADLGFLVEAASKVTRLLDNNPKKLTNDDIRTIYLNLFPCDGCKGE